MILLPLGPKGKLPNLPLMSIAVGLCTIAFSIFSFQLLDRAITRTMKHEGYRISKELAENFAGKWCETEALKTSDCRKLTSHLSAYNLLSRKNFLRSIESSAPGSTQKVKLESFANQLFEKLQATPEWQPWRDHVQTTYENGHWLTSQTMTFISIMKAQFTHGGWVHLITNMIFFFAFAGALEMRLGIISWLVLYFVGGATGLILQASSTLPMGTPLVGASAGISALAGAYLTFFWKHPTKVLFSIFIFNKVVLIPTFAFVLVMLVSQDIAGSLGELTTTAHFAHLSGLVFGAVFAFIHRLFVHHDLAFLYPHEQDLFEQAQDSNEALAIYDQILIWNPENLIVRDLGFAEVAKHHVPRSARIAFYQYHLDDTVSQLRREKDYERLIQIVDDLTENPEPEKLAKILNRSQCVALARIFSQLDAKDVLEKWGSASLAAYPQLKTHAQFQLFLARNRKINHEGAKSA